MNSKTKNKILRITAVVLAVAFMMIPFIQVKVFLGAALAVLFYFNTCRMRAIKREKDVIILSEDEVKYQTRKKEEPVKKSEAVDKTKARQEEAKEETAGAKEKVKTSAYTL